MSQAVAYIYDNRGAAKGTVVFEQIQRARTKVEFNLTGFTPFSIHAIHIHEFGDLRKGCDSLGAHYNPLNNKHGSLLSKERHKGDLINNFKADLNGNFKFSYIDDLNISDIYGRSVVIHDLFDDLGGYKYNDFSTSELTILSKERGYKIGRRQMMIDNLNKQSYETGNAGKRIACGIIGRSS